MMEWPNRQIGADGDFLSLLALRFLDLDSRASRGADLSSTKREAKLISSLCCFEVKVQNGNVGVSPHCPEDLAHNLEPMPHTSRENQGTTHWSCRGLLFYWPRRIARHLFLSFTCNCVACSTPMNMKMKPPQVKTTCTNHPSGCVGKVESLLPEQ